MTFLKIYEIENHHHNKRETKGFTWMLIIIPETALALENSRNSGSVMNLPLFLKAGLRARPEEAMKGFEI